jgi:uncharacterized Zn finger protein (UPF0148 family)
MSWKACIRCGDATMIEIEGEAVCPACLLNELAKPTNEASEKKHEAAIY